MDILPTLFTYRQTNKDFATAYMWWFFLIQKEPLPEHMIGFDPDFFLKMHFEVQNGTLGALTDEALAEYRRCFSRPEEIHAICEDFRASADIDLEMDEADEKAGRKIEAPLLVLWADMARQASCPMCWMYGVAMPMVLCKADLSNADIISRRKSLKKPWGSCNDFSLKEKNHEVQTD